MILQCLVQRECIISPNNKNIIVQIIMSASSELACQCLSSQESWAGIHPFQPAPGACNTGTSSLSYNINEKILDD
jgi:hypothetical protein